MADSMLSNEFYSDKEKDNELIYFGSLMCELLTEIQSLLRIYFKDDYRVNLLLSIKDKWIAAFYSRQNICKNQDR